MKKYDKVDTPTPGKRSLWIALPIAAISLGSLSSNLVAEAIFDENFEAAALGTLAAETHPGWTGMLADNQTGSDPADWKVVEGAGLTWVAPDGGVIDGGNRHLEMTAISNNTGRAFYDFAAPLPTDIGEPTSIYLRYTIAFDEFENIADPEAEWTVWPLFRFNGSWQMRSILKFKHNDWSGDKDVERFFGELHNDKDAVAGLNTVVFLEDKLGEPQPQATYLVVTRYDFDQAGVLLGQAIWVNPSFADGEAPDLVSNHAEPGYDTFVNPVVSMDITTYGGTMRYDNLKVANSWADVVPQAATAIFEEDFETAALGTLAAETHPGWTGMLADNQTGSDPADWKVVEGAGLTWVAPDGGVIDGGNRHLEMTAISNNTGRAFYDFEAPLPTDIGEPTSIYLRYTIAFDEFENIADPEAEWTVWPLFRFNGSWQMRSILKFKHNDWSGDKDVERFFGELHNDKDAVAGLNTVVFLEDKLGEPQPLATYLVVTRYDFDQAGVLLGQAIWVNPSFADGEAPDLVSNHAEPGYDTFVNPIVSMDITTYGGTMRYDNLKVANSWASVVPQASGTTWYGYAVDANGWVNTGNWMSWVNVIYDPWIWSTALDKYVAISDDTGWVYVPK